MSLSPKEHQLRHVELHKMLDELVACYLSEREADEKIRSIHNEIYDLMKWSHKKTLAPSEPR